MTAEQDPPSKSALKREMHALQKLGEQVLALPAGQRAALELPDQLREALELAASMKSHEARRRQLQYIGKLMRTIDPEPLRSAVNGETRIKVARTAAFHELESLRDELISDGDPAIDRLLARWPNADRVQIRQWVRAARSARKRPNQRGVARPERSLFRYLESLQADENNR